MALPPLLPPTLPPKIDAILDCFSKLSAGNLKLCFNNDVVSTEPANAIYRTISSFIGAYKGYITTPSEWNRDISNLDTITGVLDAYFTSHEYTLLSPDERVGLLKKMENALFGLKTLSMIYAKELEARKQSWVDRSIRHLNVHYEKTASIVGRPSSKKTFS